MFFKTNSLLLYLVRDKKKKLKYEILRRILQACLKRWRINETCYFELHALRISFNVNQTTPAMISLQNRLNNSLESRISDHCRRVFESLPLSYQN